MYQYNMLSSELYIVLTVGKLDAHEKQQQG